MTGENSLSIAGRKAENLKIRQMGGWGGLEEMVSFGREANKKKKKKKNKKTLHQKTPGAPTKKI